MSKIVPIQSIYCSNEDETRLCSFNTEVISAPTTPLIHPMSRLWLINGGEGTLLLNDKKYPLAEGTLVSVLPWQITDVIEVKAPLQFFVVAYYFDNINEIIKTFYNPDSVNLSVTQFMSKTPVVSFDKQNHFRTKQLFLQIKEELRTQSQMDFSGPDSALKPSPESLGLSKLYITNKLIEIIVTFIRTRHTLPAQDTSTQPSDIFQYLYTHLNEKLTLSMLSQQFYLSESAISSYIKKTYHCRQQRET